MQCLKEEEGERGGVKAEEWLGVGALLVCSAYFCGVCAVEDRVVVESALRRTGEWDGRNRRRRRRRRRRRKWWWEEKEEVTSWLG